MKKCFVFAVVFCLFVFSGCAKDEETETIELRLAEMHHESHITTQADYEFARLVEEKSNGEIKVTVYSDGELGTADQNLQMLYDGELDFVRTSPIKFAEFSEMADILQFPYLFRDSEHMWRTVETYIIPRIDADIYYHNAKLLACYDAGARNIYADRPINTIDDLKGLKIRVTDAEKTGVFFNSFGANPVVMDYINVYDALKTGTVNGAENNFTSYYNSKHYEFAKYVTKVEYSRVPDVLVVDRSMFEGLTESQQNVIISSANQASLYQRSLWQQYETDIENKLASFGCVITEPSQEFVSKMRECSNLIYSEYPNYADLINQIKSIQ